MRKERVFLSIGAAIVLILAAAPIVLAPEKHQVRFPAAGLSITPSRRGRSRRCGNANATGRSSPSSLSTKRRRLPIPVPYGVLQRANIADVTVVAGRAAPVPLHPFSRLGRGPELLRIEPQSTTQASMSAFLMVQTTSSFPPWSRAIIRSSWTGYPRNRGRAPDRLSMRRSPDARSCRPARRSSSYHALGLRRRPSTGTPQHAMGSGPAVCFGQWHHHSTGITASMPTMIALIEAIAGRPKAEQVARDLGLDNWDARHRSSAFQLTWEHQKTYLRNWLSFWRHETLGVPVSEGVDEIALLLRSMPIRARP